MTGAAGPHQKVTQLDPSFSWGASWVSRFKPASGILGEKKKDLPIWCSASYPTIALFSTNIPSNHSELLPQPFYRWARPHPQLVGGETWTAASPFFWCTHFNPILPRSLKNSVMGTEQPPRLLHTIDTQMLDFFAVPVKHHWTVCSLSPRILFLSLICYLLSLLPPSFLPTSLSLFIFSSYFISLFWELRKPKARWYYPLQLLTSFF